MVRVKICGVKQVGDAQAAILAGAHAIGLNFVPESSRFIGEFSRARELVEQTAVTGRGAPSTVLLWAGVFANHSADEILRAVDRVGLQIVQLHGEESAEFAAGLRGRLGPGVSVWKAFGIAEASDLLRMREYSACDAFVIDAKCSGMRGGSGKTFDWTLLQNAAREKTWVLAGGLNPENVELAVRTVAPDWVDVASGVESAPGIKDAAKIARFIQLAAGVGA